MTPAPRLLELELESTGDPIQGRIREHDEEPIPFSGWLELIAAVQRLTTEQRPRSSRPPAAGGDRP
jgi:hypothetical protein